MQNKNLNILDPTQIGAHFIDVFACFANEVVYQKKITNPLREWSHEYPINNP